MKKYLFWLIPVVFILALGAGYLYFRSGPEKYREAQPAVTPPEEKAEEEGGRGGGPVNLEVVIDGRTIRVVTPADLEKIPKDPPPVLSHKVRPGWEIKKILPELNKLKVDRLVIGSGRGQELEVNAQELKDPQRIFFFSPGKRGNLSLVPINLKETHKIPAGRKARGLKKIIIRDVNRVEIFAQAPKGGVKGTAGGMPRAITAPAGEGPGGGGGDVRGSGRGGPGREGREGRGQGKGQVPSQIQGRGKGGGQGGGRGRGSNPGQGQGQGE